jgi:hypothetical protein
MARRLSTMAAAALFAAAAPAMSHAQATIEDVGGIRYQVTRETVPQSVPVTEMREQTQTIYRQQVTTDTVQHQQVYSVPVTQYQVVSRLHGRWNPFIQPYWTHHYEPVTSYQTQVATVNVPVNRVAWAPETRTVQTPVTTYRTANAEIVRRTPIGAAPTAIAAKPLGSSQPSATLAARPSEPTPIGGQSMTSDPPRQATGWQAPAATRYQ